MGFGLNYESAGGGDIVPVVKFDARAGRFFRIDRADGVNSPVDITRNFKAVADLENVEVGYIKFGAGEAPDFVMVPLGQPMPAKPSPDHKQGIRIMLKLGRECGGDVREISTTAKVGLRGLDELHTAYENSRESKAGQLPIVALKDTIPVTSEGRGQKSTNYQPVFEITGWAPRPNDLVHAPRGGSAPAAAAPAPDMARAAPPSTGSTQVPPPAAASAAPAEGDAEDFG